MNVDAHYKKIKADATALVARERELKKRLEEVKKLKAQNQHRKDSIAALEAELAEELGSL
jgi:uncharacterized protein (DUF3084 family)